MKIITARLNECLKRSAWKGLEIGIGMLHRYYYDRKAVKRCFKPGDICLLLLPTDHNKLLMHWKGPYEIVKKQSEHDYIVRLGGNKEKVFHINMLKPYFTRKKEAEDESTKTEVIA